MNELVQLDMPTLRDKILAAEAFMKTLPQVELQVFHHFSKGVYARELHIPAGTILTGQIHKYENLNILSKGMMQVSTEDGIVLVEAPFTVVSPPGTKRMAQAITDCVWTTIHGTDETDLGEIEKFFVVNSETEWLEFCGQLTLGIKE